MRYRIGLLLILLLITLSYTNVIHGQFQFDDYNIVSEDFHIFSISRDVLTLKGFISRLLTADRPLTKVTFWLSYALGGTAPWAFHLLNIIIHLLAVVLVYLFMKMLLRDLNYSDPDPLALSVAGLWGVHPLQTEAVSYIIQRAEVLASAFYLLTLIAFLKAVSEKSPERTLAWYATGLAGFLLGWASKPITITLPVVFVLYVYLFRPEEQRRRAILFMVPIVAVGLVAGVYVLRSFKGSTHVGFDIEGLPPWHYFLTQMVVLIHYLRFIFLPLGQCVDHDFPVYKSLWQSQVLASMLFWIVLLSLVIYLLIKRKGGWYARVASFGLLWFVIILSPTSSVVPLKDVMVEHRLYLAMLGVVFATVVILKRFLPDRAFYGLCLLFIIVLAFSTYQRNFVWQSKLSLWLDAVKKSPNKARVHNNLGKIYIEEGRLSDAEREFLKTISLDPAHVSAYNNLSAIYLQKELYQKAADYALMALNLQPEYVQARINLGTALYYLRDLKGALREFLRALDSMPDNPGLLNNIGSLYAEMGQFKKAEGFFLQAIRLKPDFDKVYLNMGIMYLNSGRPEEAIESLNRALSLGLQEPRLFYFLAQAYRKAGNNAMAERYYRDLKGISPSLATELERQWQER